MIVTLYSISPSKLGTWQDCPRRFWLQYVEKLRVSGSWAHLSMGNAIHYALRDWWDVAAAERTQERLAALMAEHWRTLGFRDQEQSDQWRQASVAMTWHYLQQLDPGFVPHSCERSLAARTHAQAINGRIDRLDEAGDARESLIVVDYKTGRRVPTLDDVRGSFALAIYALCVQHTLRRPCSRVELHHVPSGVRVGHDVTDESLQRQLRRVEQIAGEMAQAETEWRADRDVEAHFPANPSALCGWCDYRDHCPAGMTAAPAQVRWAGLAESVDAAPSLLDE